MKKQELNLNEQQKLIRYFQKTTQILLNLFAFIDHSPPIIQIHNIIDYAYNIHIMVQQFYNNFQKKFVSFQVFKKLQIQLNQKTQKIAHLMNSYKNLKIQFKVMQDQLKEAQNNLKQIQQKNQFILPQKIRKNLIEKQKQTSIEEHSKLEKTSIQIRKKRMSLPQLPSSSNNLVNRQKFIKISKKKKSLFVDVPGQGNEVLIQHLMNKVSIK